MKPTKSESQYEAHYGLTMEACMQKDRLLVQKGYVATSLRVFNNKNQVLCTGIWENRNGRSNVQVGQNLETMYRLAITPAAYKFIMHNNTPEICNETQTWYLDRFHIISTTIRM